MTDYTIAEAAREIGVAYDALRRLVIRHKRGYKREGSQTRYLSPDDLEFLRGRIGQRGRAGWLSNEQPNHQAND